MSYDAQKIIVGRQPFTVVGIDTDYCQEVHGSAPCTATETGDNKCFNTYATCNDTDNFNKGTREYKFCEPLANIPKGQTRLYPFLAGPVDKAAASITIGTGLGERAVITVKLIDVPHHDRYVDDYIDDRTYDAQSLGTFFGKFLRRNKYYERRVLTLYHGYIDESGFSWSDFETQKFIITKIDGPFNGIVTITAKDILAKTYGDQSLYPVLSGGRLNAAITSGATSLTLTPSGIGATDYGTFGYVRIDDEIIYYTRVSDVLTLTRAQWGTTASAHVIDAHVQECTYFDGTNVTDAVNTLLSTLPASGGPGLTATQIDTAGTFAEEKALFLATANIKGIISKPEPMEDILSEWSKVFLFDIWFDLVNDKAKIKSLSPEKPDETPTELTEGVNIIDGSLRITRDSKKRFTRVNVNYGLYDYTQSGDESGNYQYGYETKDETRESSSLYDSVSIESINSRWFEIEGNAAALASRLAARFADTVESIEFDIDQKDHDLFNLGDRINVTSWQFQDATGATESRKYQVVKMKEKKNDVGDIIQVTALTSSYAGRYGFIHEDTMTNDYSSATDNEKKIGAFICQDTNVFGDGEEAYKII